MGQAWGIFLRSDDLLRTLRRHLRTFLRVKDESGRFLLFRYYDPRVLRIYLPTCHEGELKTVFGSSIIKFHMEGRNPASIVSFELDLDGQLRQTVMSLGVIHNRRNLAFLGSRRFWFSDSIHFTG